MKCFISDRRMSRILGQGPKACWVISSFYDQTHNDPHTTGMLPGPRETTLVRCSRLREKLCLSPFLSTSHYLSPTLFLSRAHLQWPVHLSKNIYIYYFFINGICGVLHNPLSLPYALSHTHTHTGSGIKTKCHDI